MMNILISQLKQKQDLQKFLSSFLDHLYKYFQSKQPMSQIKNYQDIAKIAGKIKKYFPQNHCIENACQKLKFNSSDRIKDKYQQSNLNNKSNKQKNNKRINKENKQKIENGNGHANSLLSVIQDDDDKIQFQTDQAEQQCDFGYIRKTLLQQIQLFKEDFMDHEEILVNSMIKKLGDQERIVFMNGYLNNLGIIQEIFSLQLSNNKKQKSCQRETSFKIESFKQVKGTIESIESIDIASTNQKPNKKDKNDLSQQSSSLIQRGIINLIEISKYIRKATKVIISAELVTKNGGILAPSGSLMLAINAKKYNISTIALTRGVCLSNKIILGQQILTQHINPSACEILNNQGDACQKFKVLIGKRLDYIAPQYISTIMTEIGQCCPKNIDNLYQQYYEEYQ